MNNSNSDDLEEQKLLQARFDALEAQQAIMAGFISVLLQMHLMHFSEPEKSQMKAVFEDLFERTIARSLASEIGFTDATIQAMEQLKNNMLSVIHT